MAFIPLTREQATALADSLVYNEHGLIPAIAQDAENGDVLMLAWMNRESFILTMTEGRVTYWSRSRQQLWRKGDTSGNEQRLVDIRLDCDGDTLLLKVHQHGPACHTGARSCFFQKAGGSEWETVASK